MATEVYLPFLLAVLGGNTSHPVFSGAQLFWGLGIKEGEGSLKQKDLHIGVAAPVASLALFLRQHLTSLTG